MRDFAHTIGAAGDAIATPVDRFARLAMMNVPGYAEASAQLVYEKLIEISALATRLISSNAVVAQSLEEYVSSANVDISSDEKVLSWALLTGKMTAVLRHVAELPRRVGADRSHFVLEPAYYPLVATLTARQDLLTRLQSISPPPTSREALDLLKPAASRYRCLISDLAKARDEMNAYLKAQKRSKGT